MADEVVVKDRMFKRSTLKAFLQAELNDAMRTEKNTQACVHYDAKEKAWWRTRVTGQITSIHTIAANIGISTDDFLEMCKAAQVASEQ